MPGRHPAKKEADVNKHSVWLPVTCGRPSTEPALQQLWNSLQQQPYLRDVRLALMHYLQQARQVDKANALLDSLRQINPYDPMLQPRPANPG